MSGTYIVHGGLGTGSVMVEAALTLLGLPYDVVEAGSIAALADDAGLAAVNPMRQVPALVLPNGAVMTESAAILMWLADDHPEARLAPTMAAATRPAFLRWMSFISAQIYSLFWIRDDPTRLCDDPAAAQKIKAATGRRITACWQAMDAQVDPGRYILGDDLTVLDLYVTVVSRWAERRRRFYEVAPKMSEVGRRVDADQRLAELWAARHPFSEGWEG
jgi:GST-like protein